MGPTWAKEWDRSCEIIARLLWVLTQWAIDQMVISGIPSSSRLENYDGTSLGGNKNDRREMFDRRLVGELVCEERPTRQPSLFFVFLLWPVSGSGRSSQTGTWLPTHFPPKSSAIQTGITTSL